MVYDLGGGTFDVSILDISSGVIEVLATAGNNHLGGDDFDQCIVDYLVSELKKQAKIDLPRDPAAMQRVREAAEKAKIELSSMTQTTVEQPYIAVGKQGPLHMEIPLTRAKFNDLTYHLVQATREPVNQAINDSGGSIAQISKVLMASGCAAEESRNCDEARTRIRTRNFVGAGEFFEPYDSLRFMFEDKSDEEEVIYRNLASLGDEMEAAWRRILLADALFMNTDRHMRNFGVIRSAATGDILRLAPNFDNNQAY